MTIFYPDISSYQAGIDLSKALAVCAKATEGTGYVNPHYADAKAEAAKHGAFFFAYHFLLDGHAADQASFCYGVTGKTPLMLDFEPEYDANGRRISWPGLDDAAEFIDAYRRNGGTVNLVYLPRWYWLSIGSPPLGPLASRGVQLISSSYTSYTDNSSGDGWQPYGGMTPVIWQYSSTVPFGGKANVDFNAFRGTHGGDQSDSAVKVTLDELRRLAATGKVGQAPKPPSADWDWTSNGKYSLAVLASSHGTDVATLTWKTFNAHSQTGTFNGYINAGDWSALVPAGIVIRFPAGH